jgi:hypothetical protein
MVLQSENSSNMGLAVQLLSQLHICAGQRRLQQQPCQQQHQHTTVTYDLTESGSTTVQALWQGSAQVRSITKGTCDKVRHYSS